MLFVIKYFLTVVKYPWLITIIFIIIMVTDIISIIISTTAMVIIIFMTITIIASVLIFLNSRIWNFSVINVVFNIDYY